MSKIIVQDVLRFFNFFSSDTYTYCYFDKNTGKPVPGCATVFDTAEACLRDVQQNENITAHLLINASDGNGRKTENITHPRAFYIDIDEPISTERIKEIRDKYQPHMIVESSPGKYHVYWKCDTSLHIKAWQIVQIGIASMLKADTNMGAPTSMLRVPGIPRLTKDKKEFTPKIVLYKADPEPVNYKKLFRGYYSAYKKSTETKRSNDNRINTQVLQSLEAGVSMTNLVVEPGRRNSSLFQIGKTLVATGRVSDKKELTLNLTNLNSLIQIEAGGPLSNQELITIVDSAWKNGLKVYEHNKKSLPKASQQFEYKLSESSALEPYGSDAVLERFFQRYGHLVCRIEETTLRVYDERTRTWETQHPGYYAVILHYMSQMVKEIAFSGPFAATFGGSPINQAKLSKSRDMFAGITACDRYSRRVLQELTIQKLTEQDFDKEPDLLYCQNGVLNMQTGELREARYDDYLSKRIEYSYTDKECPRWRQFIRQIFAKNDEPERMALFIQELFGYSLSGNMSIQSVYCHLGSGANGKSTLLKMLTELSGPYSRKLSPDKFSKRNIQEFQRIAVALINKRCAVVDDIETTGHWSESMIKNLTDTKLESRMLYQESKTLRNSCKVHMGLNDLPKPETNSDGFYRRLRIIPYNAKFKNDPAKHREIEQMMTEEAEGVLRWAIEGYQRFLRQGGFTVPQETEAMSQDYREDSSLPDGFLEDLYEYDEQGFITPKELMDEVNAYIRDEGNGNPYNKTAFGLLVKETFGLNLVRKRDKDGRSRGYRLRRKKVGHTQNLL
jgi:P4 family phage/plasmid primase-like protien